MQHFILFILVGGLRLHSSHVYSLKNQTPNQKVRGEKQEGVSKDTS